MGSVPSKPPTHFLTYVRTDSEHQRHLTGGASLVKNAYQIEAWSDSAENANTLATEVREGLDNVRGTIGSGTRTQYINGAFLDSSEEQFLPPTDASNMGRHAVIMDWTIWTAESSTP
jgi:hypothetical protein